MTDVWSLLGTRVQLIVLSTFGKFPDAFKTYAAIAFSRHYVGRTVTEHDLS